MGIVKDGWYISDKDLKRAKKEGYLPEMYKINDTGIGLYCGWIAHDIWLELEKKGIIWRNEKEDS